jgi:hypothetical protein
VDNISPNPLRQSQSQDNLITSSTAEIKPPIIMNKRIEVNQSMSSGGFPLLTQRNESPTTPDKNQVNRNDCLIYSYSFFVFRKLRENSFHQ